MRAFPTGVEWMPTIFVNDNGLCFLERTRKSWETSQITHLHRREAKRYSETFQLHELKAYLASIRSIHYAE